MRTPSNADSDITAKPWFGPTFAVLLFALPCYAIVADKGAWPVANYAMYSAPFSPALYDNYHRVAVAVVDGKPVWWKPVFPYQARNVAGALTAAFGMPESDPARASAIERPLAVVDKYLREIEPHAPVETLYVFRRQVDADLVIRDELVLSVPRKELGR